MNLGRVIRWVGPALLSLSVTFVASVGVWEMNPDLSRSVFVLSVLSIFSMTLALLSCYQRRRSESAERKAKTELDQMSIELSRLAALVTSSEDAIISKKLNGEILTWNRSAEKLFGYTASEMIGKSIQLLIPEELQAEEFAIFNRICAGDAGNHYPTKRIRKDGTLVDVSLTVSAIHDPQGKIIGGSCSMRNISDAIAAQQDLSDANHKLQHYAQELFSEKKRLQAVLDLNTDGWWDWSLPISDEGYMSPGYKALLGYEDHEIPNTFEAASKLIHPEDMEKGVKVCDAHLASDGKIPFSLELRFKHRSGKTLYVLCKAKAVKNERGEYTRLLGIHTDITRLKEIQHGLERSNKELEQFAAVAAHDLRSPLKAIQRWTEMIDRAVTQSRGPIVEEGIRFIRASIQKADALVGDLLDVARLNASHGDWEPVDLNQLVRTELGAVREELLATGAQVNCQDLPMVVGNPNHLQTLFANFIRNALKYRDDHRPVRITVGSVERWDAYEFFVKDNGIGIDPEHHERVFEMFTRLHGEEKYAGTGIGLALCKKVVEFRGGKIWVQSTPGEGSTFFFTLPKRKIEEGTYAATASHIAH